jgi:hypothetical protein
MEQTDLFPKRLRRVAVATGVASALALFPIYYLLDPVLLILGGIIQPRFPSTGRWFVWAGSAMLGPVLMLYDVMMIRDAFSSAPYTSIPLLMNLTFPPATILLVWCYAELVADGIKRIRGRRSRPPAEPRPVGWGEWAVAAFFTLYIAWAFGGLLGWYRDLGDHHLDTGARSAIAMQLVMLLLVVGFDISVVGRFLKTSKSRIAQF